jgi:hypothetical protein
LIVVGVICVLFTVISVANTPLLPNGLTGIDPGKSVTSASCARCHKGVFKEWRGSQHASAATDPIFGHSWRNWPKAWCLNCHMPLISDQVEAFGGEPKAAHLMRPQELHGEGVGCVACHVREGKVLTPSTPSRLGALFHELRQEPSMSESSFCAGCHQFNFQNHTPTHPFSYGDEPLQNTYAEWESSGAAVEGIQCQGCHMPKGAHTFPGAHDHDLLKDSLSVLLILGDDGYELTVSARGVGHNVPTGDPFRRLVVELLAGDQVLVQQDLSREHRMTESSFELVADHTLPTPQKGLSTSRTWVVEPASRPDRWRMWMYYGDRRFESKLQAHQIRSLIDEGLVGQRPSK